MAGELCLFSHCRPLPSWPWQRSPASGSPSPLVLGSPSYSGSCSLGGSRARYARPRRPQSDLARVIVTWSCPSLARGEIAELNEALNELRYALDQSEGRQRDFLLSISHELRTPLTAILGYGEALADGIVAQEDLAHTGRTLNSEAQRLNLLVADLLDLARLDAVDFRISGVQADFAAIAASAANVWEDRCANEGLRFSLEVPEAPLQGRTDPTRVRQIIDNLCTNALRVTPVGGSVVLAVRPSEGTHEQSGQSGREEKVAHPGSRAGGTDREDEEDTMRFVDIEVRDSGPGLTPDDCQVAFDPAELYNRYRGIRRVGTGVGLALVGRLAGRLGGSAVADSAPEGGARFTVTVARTMDGEQ